MRLGVERKICGLDLVYTLFVGSFYTVDLSQSHFGSFVYAHASDWFFSLDLMFAPPVLDLSCIRTLDLHLACFLHLLCWILFVFVHWIFDCVVSVAILWIKPLENPFCRSANIVVYFSGFVVSCSDFVVVGGPSTSNFFIVLPTSCFLFRSIFFVRSQIHIFSWH